MAEQLSRMPRRRRVSESTAPSALRWLPWAVFVLAVLRVVGLDRWGLWIDEAHTLHDARALDWGRLNYFPLNLFLIGRVLAFTEGQPSEALLRALPASVGIAGLFAIYFGWRRVIGPQRAWVAALLVGLSSWHIYWCQSARHYTMAQTLSLCGGGLVLSACIGGRPLRYVLGLALASLAALAHPSAAFVVPALILAPWLSARIGAAPKWSPPTIWLLLIGAIAALLAAKWGAGVWLEYASKKAGSSLDHFVLSSAFYIGPPLALAALWAAFAGWRARDPADTMAALLLLLVLGGATAAACFAKVAAQYVFVVLPWLTLLASRVVLPAERSSWASRLASAAVLAWGAVDVTLYFTSRHGDRPRWKEAYAFVARSRGPDDLVAGMAVPVGEYYLGPENPEPRLALDMASLTVYDARLLDIWARRERRMWFVVSREELSEWPSDQRRRFERFLREQCEQLKTFAVRATPRDLDLAVYVR
ncbi:MAG: glycosyltransferase family 39 protein [Planctomycetes bacterium]|nr:glycosyltransferase family 39 protein [Planctomycetota bacterium]